VDELVIAGYVGEEVDIALADLDPGRGTEARAHLGPDFVELRDRHCPSVVRARPVL
jgi:hypothetical protein